MEGMSGLPSLNRPLADVLAVYIQEAMLRGDATIRHGATYGCMDAAYLYP